MRAPQLSPEELVEAGEAYARATGYPIQYNTTEGMPYVRPSWEKAADIARRLHRRHILTKLRMSAGQDVDGGCGQLRARAEKPERPARKVIPLVAG